MTTRRSFLGSLVTLPFVPAVLPISAAAPAPLPVRHPEQHNPTDGPDYCTCRDCKDERIRRENHGLTCAAIIALDVLDAALARLIATHCDDGVGGCDICTDADGLRFILGYGTCSLDGQVIPPDDWDPLEDRRRNAVAQTDMSDPPLACILALYDALDALLALVDGHCPRGGCCVCIDADGLIHHVRAGLDLIGGALSLRTPALERELASARFRIGLNGWSMPHADRECGGTEDNIALLEQMLERRRDRAAT
jgi:hypothetical protein